MRKLMMACVALAALSIRSSDAGEYLRANEGTMIIGMGALSCAFWNKHHRELGHEEIASDEETWVSGFISGASAYARREFHVPDPNTQRDFISAYCRERPDDGIAEAASGLIGILAKRASQ